MKLGKVVGLFSSVSGVLASAEALAGTRRADELLYGGVDEPSRLPRRQLCSLREE